MCRDLDEYKALNLLLTSVESRSVQRLQVAENKTIWLSNSLAHVSEWVKAGKRLQILLLTANQDVANDYIRYLFINYLENVKRPDCEDESDIFCYSSRYMFKFNICSEQQRNICRPALSPAETSRDEKQSPREAPDCSSFNGHLRLVTKVSQSR